MRCVVLTLAAFLLFPLAGCDSDDAGGEATDLDGDLSDALAAASDEQGRAYFLLPASGDLGALPQDPSNPVTPEKVELGRLLFHETALAVNAVRDQGVGTYSCASCHHAGAGFQAGVPQGIGEGGIGFGRFGERRQMDPQYEADGLDTQPVRTPTALNSAYQDVSLWNGQFGATGTNAGTEAHWTEDTPIATNRLGYQGVETQAIAGLAVHRMEDGPAAVYDAYPEYRALFDSAFPDWPDAQRATTETAGLAIAAYERTLLANEAPFQKWLRGESTAMTRAQKRGAIVFFERANCAACHTGPALNSMTFHALGMGELLGPGVFSDFNPTDPVHLGRASFTDRDEDRYTFKTPQLYNLADHVFLGHGASFNTIREVVAYKNRAESESDIVPTERLSPLFVPQDLTPDDIDDLTMFLTQALYDPDLARYVPARLPSGQCFPNNDAQTRADLGCGGERAQPGALVGRGRSVGAVE